MNKKLKLLLVFLFLILGIILSFKLLPLNKDKNTTNNQTQSDQLKLISTNPDPLDNVTIIPTQDLEFTFNKPFYKSEFKHKFDPLVEHDVEVVNGENSERGSTFRIKFRKPLPLGSGYTLMIEASTKIDEDHKLDRDYIYHFRTIQYKGV